MPIVIGIITTYSFYNTKIDSLLHNQKQTLKQVNLETNEFLERIDHISAYVKHNYHNNTFLLKNIVAMNDNITGVIILDKKGMITDSYSPKNSNIYNGFDYSNKLYFKEIINGKEYFWSDLFFSTVDETQSLSYSFKLQDKVGVIFIRLTDISSFIKTFKNTDNSHMVRIYDNKGILILNPDEPKLQTQKINLFSQSVFVDLINKVKPYEQTPFFKNNSGSYDLGMYTTIEKTGWNIVIRECYDNILSDLKNLIIAIAGIVLLFITISIFIIIKISKKVFTSLDDLENITSSITSGRYNTKVQDANFDEFNGLINSFKNMQHEIKKREVSLKKSVESFESLINSTMEAILLHENGVCFDLNEVAVKLLGYENKNEIINKNLYDFVETSYIDVVTKNMEINSAPYEIKMIKKDGTIFDALVQGKFIEINNKTAKVSAIIDITELKEKDKLLFEQSKMAAMGEMIGNIAHQWRQPLSTISTASSGMKFQKEYGELSDKDFICSIDAIVKSTKYLSNTIDDFRNFFKADTQMREFNINDAIKNSLSLIDSSLKSSFIHVQNEINKDEYIYGLKNEFIQAIMNIITNAKDAFLINGDIDSKIIMISLKKSNNYLVISIQDNAGGISNDIISKIFEPYFTTKHKSQGTGIGLYMTHQIITEHMNGNIKVRNKTFEYNNKKYKGANFVIKFRVNSIGYKNYT